jgi:hypothetical protein
VAYAALNTDFLARLTTYTNPSTRTPVTRDLLNESKAALLLKARALCKIINAFPGTTNDLRTTFGLNPRDFVPTPVPPPTSRPQFSVDPFGNLIVTDEATPTRRGKPGGVFAAVILTAITETDSGPGPTSIAAGQYAGIATKGRYAVPIASGNKGKFLWVYGMWINDRGIGGPLSDPVKTVIAA